MRDHEEVARTPPPGVEKDLIESLERLKWIRRALSDCQSLPEGKLRQSIQERLSVLTGEANTFQSENLILQGQLKSSQEEIKHLIEANDQDAQDDSEPSMRRLASKIMSLEASRGRWRMAAIIVTIVALIILKNLA